MVKNLAFFSFLDITQNNFYNLATDNIDVFTNIYLCMQFVYMYAVYIYIYVLYYTHTTHTYTYTRTIKNRHCCQSVGICKKKKPICTIAVELK